ncbi:hypothetical protein F3Y22_tig00013960pilonHSYRG00133 [Hibiscus syriacus]|uniref:Uncharacterized protein n=1 Tax=Hibiscus syriacus TaxID=106335 RepID=A0A6A3C2D6_HIBSY|nr:hypothetical protein F3Y22_tig00013960pilonHSYRG00133 [Hibiscus syriacus]
MLEHISLPVILPKKYGRPRSKRRHTTDAPPFHASEPLRRTPSTAFLRQCVLLFHSGSTLPPVQTSLSTEQPACSLSPSPLSLLISDLVLAFMWASAQAFRMSPIVEPPMNVVNTALSLMAYDYPADKLSIYSRTTEAQL